MHQSVATCARLVSEVGEERRYTNHKERYITGGLRAKSFLSTDESCVHGARARRMKQSQYDGEQFAREAREGLFHVVAAIPPKIIGAGLSSAGTLSRSRIRRPRRQANGRTMVIAEKRSRQRGGGGGAPPGGKTRFASSFDRKAEIEECAAPSAINFRRTSFGAKCRRARPAAGGEGGGGDIADISRVFPSVRWIFSRNIPSERTPRDLDEFTILEISR